MNFKAISMPCTEEQWLNELKPLCDKYGLYYSDLTDFDQFKYLHLDFNIKDELFITNGVYLADIPVIPYNPIEFIKACGIEVEEPKWEKLTRGGYEYKIIMEDCGNKKYPIIIIAKIGGIWEHYSVTNKGCFLENKVSYKDLIPYNPRKTELLTKKAELEKQLEEINKELNQ